MIPADFLVWPVCLAALGTAVLLGRRRERERERERERGREGEEGVGDDN